MQFADTSALLLITSDVDITIQSSKLSNIDSWNTEAILVVETSGSIIADGLVIQDCSAAEYLISLKASANPGAQFASAASAGDVVVQDSPFISFQQQPSMLINSLSTFISNSTFWGANVPFGLAAVVNVTSQTDIQIVATVFISLMTSAEEYAAISLQADSVHISNSSFFGNNGSYGALGVGGTASTISNSYFGANQATQGGAAWIVSSFANVSDSHFVNNTAWRGGAISMHNEMGIITGCEFDSNSAQFVPAEGSNIPAGGAVLLMSATATLGNGNVTNVPSEYSISSSRFVSGGGKLERNTLHI